MGGRYMGRVIWGAALALAALVLRLTAPSFPKVTERVYSRGFFKAWSAFWCRVNGLVPFSVTECSIVILIVAAALCLAGGIVCALRMPERLGRFWKGLLSILALVGGIAALWCMLGGALNYYRLPFTSYSGLEVQKSSTQDLANLCRALGRQADDLGQQVHRRGNGAMYLPDGFEGACAQVRQGYTALESQYDGVLSGAVAARPKPVRFSRIMSYCRTTGAYSFITGESNIDVDVPAYSIPSTVAHELAHVCGFMREDEANYIAYAVCRASGSTDARYSGTMLALIHTLNALYGADPAAWRTIRSGLSPAVDRDLNLNNQYWASYDTQVGKVAEQVNDTYLKANDQTDGLQSYGRMVDLLLADFRADGAI